jgi:hypothetical protein
VYDPTTGEVRSRDTDHIALWMIDTDYNEESFFVRHCYFTGGNDPYKRLKRALKADIDEDAWASLYRTGQPPVPQARHRQDRREGHQRLRRRSLAQLLAYLTEATDEFASMSGTLPPLVPIRSIDVLQAGNEAWLSVAVETDALNRRAGLSPAKLTTAAALFGDHFKFVENDQARGLSLYESSPIAGARRAETWAQLSAVLDRSLVGVDRSKLGGQWYVTVDERRGLISYEAVTFLAMHHLSEIVRYRPHAAEELLGSKYAWVLTTWVNRACDNFLLTLASRITDQEHRIRS